MSDASKELIAELEASHRTITELREQLAEQQGRQHATTQTGLDDALKLMDKAHQEWMAALDAIEDPVFIHDSEFRILRANRAYQKRTGISFKAFIGRPYFQFFPKSAGPMPSCLHALETFEDGTEENVVAEGRTYRSRSYPVHDRQGEYLYSVHSMEDITERNEIDAKLCESEAFTKVVLDNLPVGIAVNSISPSVNFNYMNDKFPMIYRVSREKLADQDAFWETVYEDTEYREYIRRQVLEDYASGDVNRMHWDDIPLARKGEVTAYISARNFPLPDEHLMISMVWDVTERKLAEQALKSEVMRRRQLMESSRDGIAVINQHHELVEVNSCFARMLGYSPEEMTDMHTWDFEASMTEKDVRASFSDLSKISATIETRHRRKDGTLLDVEVSISGTMVDGEPMVFTVCRDITERKLLETAMQRANRALRTISAGNQTLIHASDEAGLLQEMCEVAVNSGGYRMAWIGYARHDTDKHIEQMAQAGFKEGYPNLQPLTWNDNKQTYSPAGEAIIHSKTCVVQDILNDSSCSIWRENADALGYASCIALPLLDGERAFGVMLLFDEKVNVFNADEVELLEEMSGDLAFGILTLRVKLAQREHEQHLRNNILKTVEAIASIVEMRDPYTSGHQRRVAGLAEAIAQKMGMPDEERLAIKLAGVVHDLGKIQIPAELLSKPGRLNEIEFNLIKTHPRAGYEILKGIEFSWPIAEMVYQHHERMDGSGYPQGLKGDELLLGARILAVADVMEAMSSHRPYRPGLGIEAALEELQNGRSTHFDAQVVDACTALFRKDGYGLPQ